MAAYRRVYDSRHPQADYQEPGSAPETTLGNRVCATFLARNRQFDGRNVVSAYSPILAAKGLCPLGWANVIETRCTPVTGIGITFSFAFRQTAFASNLIENCVCHFTASICSLFRSSSVSWPLATQQFTRPRRSSVCDMRGLPGQLFQQSDNERNPKKPIGCLAARLCRASIAMASIRWEYSDIYTHVDTSWTSLCSASWRRLSTWHCPHLLLNAVLQPVLRRRCRAPAAVDRCLLPTGAQQQTRHTPQRLSIDGTDGRPTVTWTLLCMLWGQVNNLLSVLSPNYCRGRATGIGSPCGPTPLFDRTS